ncbi:glycosyl transferase [Ligilactobacillus salitolerans]|uniref:Glycosyl transferase n=1 Tax=Ligilactobacillus salitolerans TaxID=1808352 RepID=A0A401IQC2_9LACO|nr:glycosyltransferase family 2 protein [Ligilactobacillus salitolerans]GBG93739.1 glycosyl transferase [Ligilactobacillus salitolerans]
MQTLISIVLPVYNEEAGITQTIKVLENFVATQPQDFELLFVDDGSTDASVELIKSMQSKYRNIKLVQFSRNFGHQLAISAGIRYTMGDAVVVMDADLQDPPEVIPAMIKEWQNGSQVVYGKRRSRAGESWFKKVSASAFYRLLQKVSSIDIPLDTGDFRLMDRQVVNQLRRMHETDPFVRGMVSWIGFKQSSVEYERKERIAGTTKYPLKKMLNLALSGLTSFSDLPLKLALNLGLVSLGFSVIYSLFSLFNHFNSMNFMIGSLFGTTGLILISLGLVGIYLYQTFKASRKRPLYIVANTSGFSESEREQHEIKKLPRTADLQVRKIRL